MMLQENPTVALITSIAFASGTRTYGPGTSRLRYYVKLPVV
jgi:hypothetical protein